MKLQHLAVIFIIIIMPLSMVLSTYVGNLIKVSNQEAKYDSVLYNATYDAMRAYRINTLYDSFASVNQSRERDIRASVNSFFNSMSTGLNSTGYGKSDLNTYIPALLFTLYDGFYIYSPYSNIASVSGGKANFSTNGGNPGETEFGLHPYIYYSCQYVSTSNDYNLTVGYSLDNHISVMGWYKDGGSVKYVTGSGYYVKPSGISVNDSNRTVNYNGQTLEPENLYEYVSLFDEYQQGGGSAAIVTGKPHDIRKYKYLNYNGVKYYYDDDPTADLGKNNNQVSASYDGIDIFYLENNKRIYVNNNLALEIAGYRGYDNVADLINNFQDVSAYYYYKEALEFSSSSGDIYKALKLINLGNGTCNVKTPSYNQAYGGGDELKAHIHKKKEYTAGNGKVFDYSLSGNNPELESSVFNEHRMDVIITTIETCLSNTIQAFNKYASTNDYNYRMPAVTEDDWYRMSNNVAMLAFMQGMVVGNYKFYTGYSVVESSLNKEFISRNSIYVQNYDADNTYNPSSAEYHEAICTNFHDDNVSAATNSIVGYRGIDYEQHAYTHKATDAVVNPPPDNDPVMTYYYLHSGTAGYECLVSKNEVAFTTDDLMNLVATKNIKGTNKTASRATELAYIRALAREKEVSYKRMEVLNYH